MRRLLDYYLSSFRGLPRSVWLLCVVLFVNRAGTMVLPFFTLYLTRARGWTETQAGQALALYGAGAIFGAFIGGWLTDRLGAHRTQLFSMTGTGAGFLVLSQLSEPAAVYSCVFALGLVAESLRPANMAAISQHAPLEATARSMALARLAVNLGMGIGPVAGGFLARVGYGWLFVADAVTCWLAALLLAVLVGPSAPGAPRRADESAASTRRSAWTDLPFLALLAMNLLLGAIFFQLVATLPLHLNQSYGLTEERIGLLLALNPLLIVLFEMLIVRSVEGWRRMPFIGLGALGICLGLGLMPLGSTLSYAAFTVVVWSIGEMLCFPLMADVVSTRAPRGQTGSYLGLYHVSFALALVFGPLVGTRIYEQFGPDVLWYSIGAAGPILLLVSLALSAPFARRTETASPPPR